MFSVRKVRGSNLREVNSFKPFLILFVPLSVEDVTQNSCTIENVIVNKEVIMNIVTLQRISRSLVGNPLTKNMYVN